MKPLNKEQTEFALGRLQQLMDYRGLTQPQLQQASGIAQSKISKIMNRLQDPSPDDLRKLSRAIGVRLSDLTNETEQLAQEILGYLATPLTALSAREDTELRRVVDEIKRVAADERFSDPRFDLYWPGHHSHPRDNPELTAAQVYLMDRSRASSYDFIIVFCASPSYGVGQENEIATQAGLSAIRLVPESFSRMMKGSFLRRTDIRYAGTLATGIHFPEPELLEALRVIRQAFYRQQAFYKNLNGHDFGERLRKLVNERRGDYEEFAKDVGIDLSYLHALMQEPISISNPSVKLLKRMAALLGESVGYLVGESEKADPVLLSSNASFRAWVESNPDLPAGPVLRMRDEWREEYQLDKGQLRCVSFRGRTKAMTLSDWGRLYKEIQGKSDNRGPAAPLFAR